MHAYKIIRAAALVTGTQSHIRPSAAICQGVGVYNDGGDYENGIIASSYGCATGGTCCGWKTCTTQAVCGDLASVAYR